MKKSGLRLVFMGTPEFAASCLEAILNSRHQVVGVITAPDRPAGRGRKMHSSAVKETAISNELPVFQPEKLRDEGFLNQLSSLQADIFVVVAFRMLPQQVWSMPPIGTFNLHASLLPDYRGAAPIQHAIWNGDQVSGVTTFFINEAIDEGEILLQKEVAIRPEDNAGSLHDKLKASGAQLIVETLDGLEKGRIKQRAQKWNDSHRAAPKIFTKDTFLKPKEQSASAVHNQIRALSPYPGARIVVQEVKGDKLVWKILHSRVVTGQKLEAGQLNIEGKCLFLGTLSGVIEILFLQVEGKRAMKTSDFLNGFRHPAEFELVAN